MRGYCLLLSICYGEFKSIVNSTDLASFLSIYNSSNFNFEQHISSLSFSTALTPILIGLVNLMEGLDYSQQISVIQDAICNYYEQNKTGLNQDDLVYFGAMVDVATYSTELWMGSTYGGLNKYSEFQNILDNLCNGSVQYRGFWSNIILSDAAGMLTGVAGSLVATGGGSALPNPFLGGMPTAGAVGLVVGAGANGFSNN